MPLLPRALLWKRLESIGTDFTLVNGGRRQLLARGVATDDDPEPYSCRYELATDENCVTVGLTVDAEGAGWRRQVRLERAAGRWRVTTGEQGRFGAGDLPGLEDPAVLADALDVDLEATALTNTLPIRRLDLLAVPAGTAHTIAVAWVKVPSLRVVRAEQTYTVLGTDTIRYSSGTFTADLTVDAAGFVTHYPGYATRAGHVR